MRDTKIKPEIRKTVFVKAIRDTYVNLFKNMEQDFFIPEGMMMFHETSTNQTRYLEPDEIAVYLPDYGMCYGYRPDWVSERTISDV